MTPPGSLPAKLSGFAPAPKYEVEIAPSPKRVKVVFNGTVVAQSDRALVLRETRLPPVYYLPRDDVRLDLLQPTGHQTHCPFKGNASYWTLAAAGKSVENAVWSYEEPMDEAAPIAGYMAFYWSKMDALYEEDREVAIDAAAQQYLPENPLIDWLIREAWEAASSEELAERFTQRLLECGIPLWRLNLLIGTLNPQVRGNAYIWKRGDKAVDVRTLRHERAQSPVFLDSPLVPIYEGAGGIRRHLEGPDPKLDFPILEELRSQGATDYVAMPLHFSDGQINVITLASDAPGGFTTEHLGQIYEVLPVLSRFLEVQAVRRTTKSLLETYLGRRTGNLVLDGRVHRGDGENIPAVIWTCDLRDSTRLAETLPREAYLALLNDFFDAAAGAVLAEGGEVLKFIGDAVLAIFPIEDCPIKRAEACEAALKAARGAHARIADLNLARAETGEAELRSTLAIHLGDVTYGNVGSADRLDFTVTGPAANEVVRLEALSKDLGESVLVSEAFARLSGESLVSLGHHALRGVEGTHEIFTLSA